MYYYDILVCIKFISAKYGGRKNLPPIKSEEYTYRPIFRLEQELEGYCCGVIIGSYIKNYAFDIPLNNIKILFLQFAKVKKKLSVGKKLQLLEGNTVIATGKILEILS